ncbi:hypothetical protein EON81_03675 [bacterium]|nr:MAG: hypothetical protein EON81_03675 [bacterium]
MAANIIGYGAVLWLFVLDMPLVTGMVIADAPDPERPGGLREVFPSILGLMFRISLAIGGIVLGRRFERMFYAENAKDLY